MILVSACLAGMRCKWNLESVTDPVVARLVSQGKALPVCPEQLGGLATPREPSEIRDGRVYAKGGRDVTEEYRRGAEETLRLAKAFGCRAAILKSRSPSCGVGRVYDGSFSGRLVPGDGVAAALLKAHGLELVDESGAAAVAASLEPVDLTWPIEPGMPAYPGTEPPTLSEATTIARDGFAEKLITMFSHTGTHMDAPAHLLPGAAALDALPVSTFGGRAVVIDVPGSSIGLREVEAVIEATAGGAEYALFHTGWDERWGSPSYYDGFPVLTPEAAALIAGLGLKGVGYDCISADPVGAELSNHRVLLGAGLVIVENLRGLSPLVGRLFELRVLPLRIASADGSPVRAVAYP